MWEARLSVHSFLSNSQLLDVSVWTFLVSIFLYSNWTENLKIVERNFIYTFNLLAPELFFLILAHSVYKM